MAAYSASASCHKTLSTTVADTVTITDPHDTVQVINHDATEYLYFTITSEGNTPIVAVGAADNTFVVEPGGRPTTVESPGKRGCVLSVVGSGNAYSVQKVRA